MRDGHVKAPPETLEGWRRLWHDDHSYRARVAPAFFSLTERLFQRLLHPFVRRQADFNRFLADVLRDLRSDIDGVRADHRHDLEEIRGVLQWLREHDEIAVNRGDALISALDRKLESLLARTRDLSIPALTAATPNSFRGDFVYRRMEDALRGGSADVAASVAHYAELAREHAPLIDLGCGRGELLDAARRNGVAASGFDSNERSVADLSQRGFDVTLGEIPSCLAAIAAESVGSLVAIHVVEHLPFDVLLALFAEAARVLKKGGLLMLETPNAESLAMSARDIWRDPTHLAPRHAAALLTISREFGFTVEELATVHPYPEHAQLQLSEAQPEELRQMVTRLNELLFGPQDLRLILRKS